MNILQDTLSLNKLLYLCIGLEFDHFLQFFFSLASAGLFLCPFLWLCLKLILYQNR
nr:MAG TPA: hypothetical protein [Caudoviricetes sp.]